MVLPPICQKIKVLSWSDPTPFGPTRLPYGQFRHLHTDIYGNRGELKK
jgi:hypothetical protein